MVDPEADVERRPIGDGHDVFAEHAERIHVSGATSRLRNEREPRTVVVVVGDAGRDRFAVGLTRMIELKAKLELVCTLQKIVGVVGELGGYRNAGGSGW